MSSQLGFQELKEGTYMVEHPTVEGLIKNTLVPGNSEYATSAVWTCICAVAFPFGDGYVTAPEGRFGSEETDLYTMHSVMTPESTKHFFIIEGKPPGPDREDGRWKDAADHLETYIKGVFHNVRPKGRIFGVVALGNAVRFHEFEDGKLKGLNRDRAVYYIDRHCQTVTVKLEHIRRNGRGGERGAGDI